MFDQTLLIVISQNASGLFNVPVFQPVRPLPAVQFHVERINVEHSVPMYAPELIGTVSSLSQPSDNLLHHCYAHLYLKVWMEMLLSETQRQLCCITCLLHMFLVGSHHNDSHRV